MDLKKIIYSTELKLFVIPFFLNLILVLFIYQSVFSLEFQGDGWQYAWGHKVFYNSTLFSELAVRAMRTSLGGAHLTFALIQNNFGLDATIFYSVNVVLKLVSVFAFYFLVKKLTQNYLAALLASLLLSATFTGVEATHWVFNMYAYIGLTFIILSLLVGFDLPEKFTFKRWLMSFILACVGVWYATMRTNGIIPLIIFWSFYKFITLRSRNSRLNLIAWVIGFISFILIDKFLLGQMETDYSQKYIIAVGLQSIQSQLDINKYDFLLSPATNLGSIILPDVTWLSYNFPKTFSLIFGEGIFRSVILPALTIFTFIGGTIVAMINKSKKIKGLITPKFVFIFSLGLYWTGIVFAVSNLGPLNFQHWVYILMALFGGYLMAICLFIVFTKEIPTFLRDFFLITLIWSFVYLLLPGFQNGGPLFGTYHRYMVTTAPVIGLFIAGLISLSSVYKSGFLKGLTLLMAVLIIFSHATQTKAFFDRKALVHNKEVSSRIWQQFKQVVPANPEYLEKPPTVFFTSADNPLDQMTLFESLYFGFLFRASLDYGWWPDKIVGLYNQNYQELLDAVKKDPELLDEFYAVKIENQFLTDITEETKEKLSSDINP